jgi:3-oxoacyl-[acyl-carrier protein] reductase
MTDPTPSAEPRVALVTDRGLHVLVNYHRNQDAAEALAAELRARGRTVTPLRADVADAAAVKAMLATIRKDVGRLDVLVNSAGVLHEGLFLFTDPDRFWEVMHVNLGGVVNCCRAAIPLLGRKKSGRIVNIASIAAMHGTTGLSAYAASKAGVLALTGVLARELAGSGVRVNAVAPGLVATDMADQLASPAARERSLHAQPVSRIGRPEEVASVVAYLALDAPDYLTGEVIRVDGGAMIGP